MVNLLNPRIPTLSGMASKAIRGEWTLVDSQTNKPICVFTTFLGYSASNTSSVPSYNIEEGSFAAYNKINSPGEFSVSLAKSGTVFELNQAINQIEAYNDSTKLVNLVLPFKSYLSLNITGFAHSISEGGAVNTLVAELTLKEIKQSKRAYTNSKMTAAKVRNPEDADTVDKGRQQAKEADGSILSRWFKL